MVYGNKLGRGISKGLNKEAVARYLVADNGKCHRGPLIAIDNALPLDAVFRVSLSLIDGRIKFRD